ncbi:MAG: hypothetical protein HY438_03930 [DPANN group archaeon]|nr:hypothetical protein [DPANN group archaeon]
MAKRKNKTGGILKERSSLRSRRIKASSQKMLGIMIGVGLMLGIIGIINAVSVSFARENDNSMMDDGMMSGNMMHPMMMGGNGGMMEHTSHRGDLTEEEMEEMMEHMDKDGDGLCDYCGMSVEMCRTMMG